MRLQRDRHHSRFGVKALVPHSSHSPPLSLFVFSSLTSPLTTRHSRHQVQEAMSNLPSQYTKRIVNPIESIMPLWGPDDLDLADTVRQRIYQTNPAPTGETPWQDQDFTHVLQFQATLSEYPPRLASRDRALRCADFMHHQLAEFGFSYGEAHTLFYLALSKSRRRPGESEFYTDVRIPAALREAIALTPQRWTWDAASITAVPTLPLLPPVGVGNDTLRHRLIVAYREWMVQGFTRLAPLAQECLRRLCSLTLPAQHPLAMFHVGSHSPRGTHVCTTPRCLCHPPV